MHLKFEQKLIYEVRGLKKEVSRWKLVSSVLMAVVLVLCAKSVRANEFSTVSLCGQEVHHTFLGMDRQQDRQAELWERSESLKTEVCDAIPLAKVPYGLKWQGKEWEFSFKLILKR